MPQRQVKLVCSKTTTANHEEGCYLILLILQKEWLDKCEQAKRAKLVEENSVDAPDTDKNPKEDKAAPSRSMSLESNTLGKIIK